MKSKFLRQSLSVRRLPPSGKMYNYNGLLEKPYLSKLPRDFKRLKGSSKPSTAFNAMGDDVASHWDTSVEMLREKIPFGRYEELYLCEKWVSRQTEDDIAAAIPMASETVE